MSILTEEQKKKYLEENGANLCPFCKSTDISGGQIEIDGRIAWQEVSCSACGKNWNDLYKLFDVEAR
jgi:transposase-like protein